MTKTVKNGAGNMASPLKRKEKTMSIREKIGRMAAEYSRIRNRYMTERQVRALPLEIQKDIGWPDLCSRQH